MDHPFIWAIVITSVWYEIIRIRRYHTVQAIFFALAAHCGIIVLLGGVTPSETLQLTSKLITRLAQNFYRPLPDPLSPLGVFMLLLRWSDPQVFQGVLEIYDRPSAMLLHLVTCLGSSLCIAELIEYRSAIYQIIALPLRSRLSGLASDLQTAVHGAIPITPHAPGAFPRSIKIFEEPDAAINQLSIQIVVSESSPTLGSTNASPLQSTKPQPKLLKSALKKTNYPPLQIPDILAVTEDEDGEFSVGPTSSPWPLPPSWARLPSGYRSPGTVRMASSNWQAGQETWYEGSNRQGRDGGFSRPSGSSRTSRPPKDISRRRRSEALRSPDWTQLATIQELEVVECLLQAYIVECKAFREDSALAGNARTAEYNRLSDGLERHVILDLDKVQADGDVAVQHRRKDLVEQTQATLATLDEAMQALPIRVLIYGADENMAQAAFKKQSRRLSLSPGGQTALDLMHQTKHRKLDTVGSGGVRTPDRRGLKPSKRGTRRRIDLSDPDVDMDLMTPPYTATWAQSFSMPGLGWKDTPP
ncbi:hypothetical protein LTR37_005818 [Vermiconidia calcicola]|uniref:Uncharacterized protein n=1 Tax=Vermiconidia calcicola TaxID=1690605 RepID=A0ACC3NJU9_9PEZI|nr:hypothetical protein LTR37_005818 [Vermiconidia calcicola]